MSIRSLPYPTLEDNSLSYIDGAYEVSIAVNGKGAKVQLTHIIKGAPFIESALSKGTAKYGCLVSVPITGYRRLHLSDHPQQVVEVDAELVGEAPKLRPVILCVEDIEHSFTKEDGVDEAWCHPVKLTKGARLAAKGYYQQVASLVRMLQIKQDEKMEAGSLEVKASTESGFFFIARVAKDIYTYLQNPADNQPLYHSILTNIVTACFQILRTDYRSDPDEPEAGWKNFPDLRVLIGELEERNLPTWDDEDFRPEWVATRMYPHVVQAFSEDEE